MRIGSIGVHHFDTIRDLDERAAPSPSASVRRVELRPPRAVPVQDERAGALGLREVRVKYVPTAQASVEGTALTPTRSLLYEDGFGLLTFDQAEPFQCRTSARSSVLVT
jgi:hypothetical protein